MDLAGGGAQSPADAPTPAAGDWGPGGVILFSPNGTGPLRRVSAAGGESIDVTAVRPPQQVSHRFPHFLPDGHHFLILAMGSDKGVYVGSLESKDVQHLLDSDSPAWFASPDRIFFVRQDTLFQQQFGSKPSREDSIRRKYRLTEESIRCGGAVEKSFSIWRRVIN